MKIGPGLLLAAASALALAACSSEAGDRGRAAQCQVEIAAAEAALSHAKANNIGSSLRWTKAATLIGLAKTQEQFGEYENCVVKARSAQARLRG